MDKRMEHGMETAVCIGSFPKVGGSIYLVIVRIMGAPEDVLLVLEKSYTGLMFPHLRRCFNRFGRSAKSAESVAFG